ncbi:LOW QUALITY PROTEIN: GATA transcription factor 26-like [Dioscorea cayenensis subsp. rotundata]|uniref:LOW QUALITY PROTEIN: GATA transcription factor 26-like n=1 Tax=Dioscorea cayennensis subsp. rotundata TaxID=55577 RepID=A0AB40CRE9_DIOCR|nr:LOW QUALITY PROTEIN: GATA transcription factor 26-like [Dioscorea cayenensis subsp. rotundata]
MGKQGPCCHCGVTSTPLWRNGPPEKPVLCNACGSRWRTKGSLLNYTPMHARELIPDSEEFKAARVNKSVSFKPKEQKLPKKKADNASSEIGHEMQCCDQNFKKIREEDPSNRSSSGSAISFSESCAHFGTADASDLTAQSIVWDSLVPSRKRTWVARPKPSPVEKLTKDLYSIWHEQSFCLSASSEEDLLLENETLFGSDEIGHGGLLIRHPNSKTLDEESEASSIPTDNKSCIHSETFSGSTSFPVHGESRVIGSSHAKPTTQMLLGHATRDKSSDEMLQFIRNRDSPLSSSNLKDVFNFEVFMAHLTQEERQKLMKYLPSVDTAKPPESLEKMFSSSQFIENFSYYQQLLSEGVFDLSLLGVKADECRTLKRLVLLNLNKTKWVENRKELQEIQHKTRGKETINTPSVVANSSLTPLKRLCDSANQKSRDTNGVMRSPKRISKAGVVNVASAKPPNRNNNDTNSKAVSYIDEFVDNEVDCFSPRSLFASPSTPIQFSAISSEQDLLFDVPSNGPTPEAELLYHPWKMKTTMNGIAEGEDNLSNFPASSIISGQKR